MELHGKSVFGGIAMGRLSVYHKTDNAVKRTKITDIEAEKKRFEDAKEEAKRQLGVFYEKAVREVGEVNAAIFEMHQMMLDGSRLCRVDHKHDRNPAGQCRICSCFHRR